MSAIQSYLVVTVSTQIISSNPQSDELPVFRHIDALCKQASLFINNKRILLLKSRSGCFQAKQKQYLAATNGVVYCNCIRSCMQLEHTKGCLGFPTSSTGVSKLKLAIIVVMTNCTQNLSNIIQQAHITLTL